LKERSKRLSLYGVSYKFRSEGRERFDASPSLWERKRKNLSLTLT